MEREIERGRERLAPTLEVADAEDHGASRQGKALARDRGYVVRGLDRSRLRIGRRESSSTDEPIKVGVSLPLTGEFSQPGKAADQGYEVWTETINAEGGLLERDVELIVKDDASDQNTVVSDYNALIQRDQVDLLLGTFSSLLNLPASAAAERNRYLYIEPAGGAPEIFERDFQYGPFFTQQATADQQGDLFVDYVLGLPENERPQTAAYPVLDDPFALPVIEAMKAKLEEGGR